MAGLHRESADVEVNLTPQQVEDLLCNTKVGTIPVKEHFWQREVAPPAVEAKGPAALPGLRGPLVCWREPERIRAISARFFPYWWRDQQRPEGQRRGGYGTQVFIKMTPNDNKTKLTVELFQLLRTGPIGPPPSPMNSSGTVGVGMVGPFPVVLPFAGGTPKSTEQASREFDQWMGTSETWREVTMSDADRTARTQGFAGDVKSFGVSLERAAQASAKGVAGLGE